MKTRLQLSNHRRQWQRGAVTITYLTPSAVPAIPNLLNNTVVATVVATAAADTSAVITHGFGLTNAEITGGYPFPLIINQGDETTSGWWEASENPNYTVLQKNTLGAGPTAKVAVTRPHSIFR